MDPEFVDQLTPAERDALLRIARTAAQQEIPAPAGAAEEPVRPVVDLTAVVATAASVMKMTATEKAPAPDWQNSPDSGLLTPAQVDALRAKEKAVIAWLTAAPENVVRFTADPISALADAKLLDKNLLSALLAARMAHRQLAQPNQGSTMAALRLRADA